jgi:YidC/Oxa1 family membrane protein insertase
MLEKMTYQQRLILATAISAVLVIFYEVFFAPKPKALEQNVTTQVQKVETKQSVTTPSVSVAQVSAPLATGSSEIISKIISDKFEVDIDKYGRFSQVYLLEDKFKDASGNRQKLISELHAKPLEVRFSDPAINNASHETPFVANLNEVSPDGKSELILTQTLKDITITKKIIFNPNGSYNLSVLMSKDTQYFLTPGFAPDLGNDKIVFNGTLAVGIDGKLKKYENGSHKDDETTPKSTILASVDKYYASILYNFDAPLDIVVTADKDKDPTPFIIANGSLNLHGYVGPKTVDTLKAIEPRLSDVVEYGFFTFISKPLFWALEFIEKSIGNWGWAIVIFTIIVRILLFPITYKGMVSMNKLKELAPKLNELKEKYKGDPQKLNIHMMEMYKKHNANPMSGCLPMLLQIPIFFAIYRVLLNSIELKGAPWILWIHDLSLMDHYYVLPILMGASMFVQQMITPQNFTDPMQQKIFKYLPIVFTFFFLAFPAGLTLYWFINNLLSIAQQYTVNILLAKKAHAHKGHEGA